MKKFIACFCTLVLMTTNVCAEEIQLSDYVYTNKCRLLDGYSYVSYSDKYDYTIGPKIINQFQGIGSVTDEFYSVEINILKPNGTLLYNPMDFDVYCELSHSQGGLFLCYPQTSSGNLFVLFHPKQPYNYFYAHSQPNLNAKGQLMDGDSNLINKQHLSIQMLIENGKPVFLYNKDNPIYHTYEYYPNVINISTDDFFVSDRINASYSFRERQINGQTYYALFKELKDGETAADFAPTEKTTLKYTDYINQMYKKGLLFNNEMCFFKRGITRLDFGIVLGRAYCNATGYSIDRFTSDTHFVDINNPYCLLLNDNDILTSSGFFDEVLYVNEKEISKQVVSNALDKMAEKCGVLNEWKGVKVIQPSDAPCSRELAYTETFRLYDLIKQKNDTNYVKFTPSQILDSDSEAETMHYETADHSESTEMTTLSAASGSTSADNKNFYTVLGGVAALLVSLAAAING